MPRPVLSMLRRPRYTCTSCHNSFETYAGAAMCERQHLLMDQFIMTTVFPTDECTPWADPEEADRKSVV